MLVISAANVNDAWNQAKTMLNLKGVVRPSRVGEMLEYPGPVTTQYCYPCERVLFDPRRDSNPFFSFFEGLWMLAGRNDVAWIKQFNQRMSQFSDNGQTFHGAYGHRWRWHFGMPNQIGEGAIDQLPLIIDLLKKNHSERRAVLQMWDPNCDLGHNGVDVPCNTAVYFKIRDGRLAMTVSNRSNDIVWGCYGANVVHMSMLQEYVAAMVGVEVGHYHQVSDSWHAYTAVWEQYTDAHCVSTDYYTLGLCRPYPLVSNPERFDAELQNWMEYPGSRGLYSNEIFDHVAVPMYNAWHEYKAKCFDSALGIAARVEASDWRKACQMWLGRRADKAKERAA